MADLRDVVLEFRPYQTQTLSRFTTFMRGFFACPTPVAHNDSGLSFYADPFNSTASRHSSPRLDGRPRWAVLPNPQKKQPLPARSLRQRTRRHSSLNQPLPGRFQLLRKQATPKEDQCHPVLLPSRSFTARPTPVAHNNSSLVSSAVGPFRASKSMLAPSSRKVVALAQLQRKGRNVPTVFNRKSLYGDRFFLFSFGVAGKSNG